MQTQNLLVATPCGFESHYRHSTVNYLLHPVTSVTGHFFKFHVCSRIEINNTSLADADLLSAPNWRRQIKFSGFRKGFPRVTRRRKIDLRVRPHGNQFSKIINSEMVILTPITINNHFNNANYVTKVDHLCSERHTFNFLLKKVDFRGAAAAALDI